MGIPCPTTRMETWWGLSHLQRERGAISECGGFLLLTGQLTGVLWQLGADADLSMHYVSVLSKPYG